MVAVVPEVVAHTVVFSTTGYTIQLQCNRIHNDLLCDHTVMLITGMFHVFKEARLDHAHLSV